MLKFGHICNIESFRARVKIDDMDGFITDWLPILRSSTYGNCSNEPIIINTPVAVLLAADGQDGVILGAIYTDDNPPHIISNTKKYYSFKDGSTFEYDAESHTLAANINGEAIIKAKKTTLNGDFHVNGNIYDKTSSMQTMRDIYNSHTNPNDGVPPEKM